MAKRKRRKSRKDKGKITLIIMLAVIFVIIGIFVFKAINKENGGDAAPSPSSTQSYNQGGESNNSSHNQSVTQDSSENETEKVDSSTTTEEGTTEPVTLPINNEPEDVADIIVSHYTDFMGFSEGALYIEDSETHETANGYAYTLRLNSDGSPNKLIGDVYVEKGTGKVTDSMGNEPWNISE